MEDIKLSDQDLKSEISFSKHRPLFFNRTVLMREMSVRINRDINLLIIPLAIGLASLGLLIVYQVFRSMVQSGMADQIETDPMFGKLIFGAVMAVQLILVVGITPWATAGSISSESEKNTLNLLRTTPLSPLSILGGKLVSGFCFTLLIILTTIPVQIIFLFFGGITNQELFISWVVILTTILCLNCLGIFISSRSQKTRKAMIITYLISIIQVIFLPLIVFFIGYQVLTTHQNMTDILNGIFLPETALVYIVYILIFINPIGALAVSEWAWINQQSSTSLQYISTSGNPITLLSPWIPFVVCGLLLSLVTFLAALHSFKMRNS